MIACRLHSIAPVETAPLSVDDVATPQPANDQVLVQVSACGICRTDLHVIEGELPLRRLPLIPGHQVVGTVESVGASVTRLQAGQRVGIAWLHQTCGGCEHCRARRENLCEAAKFTGYDVDGGYAQFAIAHESFVYELPATFPDLQAAPLLCAGIIGFRALRVSGISSGGRLGLYGFGAAGHVTIQVARHLGIDVYVMTRDERHQRLAAELGATWIGGASDAPPIKMDAAIVFAPAGELVIAALRALGRGGSVVCAGIHMSPIPSFSYEYLYHERVIRSVANNTREDGEEFLRLAAAIPVKTHVELFDLRDANIALNALKNDAIKGAAVLRVGGDGAAS